MLVWFRKGIFYRIRQNPKKPLGVHFFHFTASTTIDWPDDILETLETTDPSFVESLSRRIIELYWEEYYEKAVQGGEIPGSEGVPSQRSSTDFEPISADCFPPETLGLNIPPNPTSMVLQLAADAFHVLVGEYLHLARKRFSSHEVGIQRFHRSAIADVVAKVQSDLANAPTIPQMATACGYSLDHFGRIFKKIMGCSPQDFLIKVRIARARQLLVESGMSIKEIAISVGYRSPYFFSRQFKETTGEPPTRFRERYSSKGTEE